MKTKLILGAGFALGVLALIPLSFAADYVPVSPDTDVKNPQQEIQGTGDYALMPISTELESGSETSSTVAELNRALENNLIITIAPDENVTRAQAAQIFVELLKLYDPNAPMTLKLCPFSDMDQFDHTTQNYIQNACAQLLFNGYDNGNFEGNRAITQEHFKTVLRRFAKEKDKDLVDHIIRNKALLPSLSQETVIHYLYDFYTLSQE